MATAKILAADKPLNFSYSADVVDTAGMRLDFSPDRKRALFLAEKMRADFVFSTAALEGNPFTFPEVKTLIEGITVGGHKLSDAEQVLNLNQAFSQVIGLVKEGKFRIDAETACAIQGIVARNEALTWGKFRDAKVFITGTGYEPPDAGDLPAIFETGSAALRGESDPVLRAFLAFLWASVNLFFCDGNRRTARLLANGTLLCAGLPPMTILAKDRLTYNETMTRFYDTKDGTEALTWLYGHYRERFTEFGFDDPAKS